MLSFGIDISTAFIHLVISLILQLLHNAGKLSTKYIANHSWARVLNFLPRQCGNMLTDHMPSTSVNFFFARQHFLNRPLTQGWALLMQNFYVKATLLKKVSLNIHWTSCVKYGTGLHIIINTKVCVHCLAQRRWSYRRVGIHPGNTLREQKELHMSYFYYASPTPTLFRPSGAIPTVCGQTNNLCTYQQFVDIPTVCGHTNSMWTPDTV